tara:strand:+ start:253 stop:432 length:180 start_codon:yes stop_codon:yes gene_type:complete
MCRDIVANNDSEATEICRKETEKIIIEACSKLFDLGYSEGGGDDIFITDEWDEKEDDDV